MTIDFNFNQLAIFYDRTKLGFLSIDIGTNGDAFMAIFEQEWISWVDPTRSALPADRT